jgi:DNA-binding transcriptional MerR regulator
MRISELSEATGASARSLRYYEQQGLISARRLTNGYREFDVGAAETVRRIRALLDLGLPTGTIRDILPCDADGPQRDACAGLMQRIAGIRDRLAERAAELSRTSAALDRYLVSVVGAVDEVHADPVGQ